MSPSSYLHEDLFTVSDIGVGDFNLIIDLFTDTAAILNLLDLRSIMGCSRGMSTIRFTRSVYIRVLFGPIFLQFFLEKDCNGKKDRCVVFGSNNDRIFPKKYTVKFYFCPKRARKY